jgi:hypothetical protein
VAVRRVRPSRVPTRFENASPHRACDVGPIAERAICALAHPSAALIQVGKVLADDIRALHDDGREPTSDRQPMFTVAARVLPSASADGSGSSRWTSKRPASRLAVSCWPGRVVDEFGLRATR